MPALTGIGILCTYCGNKTKVRNSIPKRYKIRDTFKISDATSRYRVCIKCGAIFYTEEVIIRKIRGYPQCR